MSSICDCGREVEDTETCGGCGDKLCIYCEENHICPEDE